MSWVIGSEQIQVLIDRFEARGAAAEKAVALYEETVAPSVARCNWSNVGHVCREIDRLEHERKVWARAVRELRDLLPTNPVLEATLDVEYGEAAAMGARTPKTRDASFLSADVRLAETEARERWQRDARARDRKYGSAEPSPPATRCSE